MDSTAVPATPLKNTGSWWRELTRYHWFVLVVASLGWTFDCLDQQLFNLSRSTGTHRVIASQAWRNRHRSMDRSINDVLHDRLGHRRGHLRHPG